MGFPHKIVQWILWMVLLKSLAKHQLKAEISKKTVIDDQVLINLNIHLTVFDKKKL